MRSNTDHGDLIFSREARGNLLLIERGCPLEPQKLRYQMRFPVERSLTSNKAINFTKVGAAMLI